MIKKGFAPIKNFIQNMEDQIRTERKAFIVYSILRILVLLTMIRSLFTGNFQGAALCLLTLILFLIPAFLEKRLKIKIPALFEIIIYLFIYSAEILGEINNFYHLIPGWDTMLHTLNGFLCAAIGFTLIDLLNRNSKKVELSPLYVALVAFCFSMTIGVLWEFFEFAMDQWFLLDMQKDFVVQQFSSVTLDPLQSNNPIPLTQISETVIQTSNGLETISNGYLDIGLLDTMKDLIVNFVGAIVFSLLGFAYIANRDKKENTPGHGIIKDLMIEVERDK